MIIPPGAPVIQTTSAAAEPLAPATTTSPAATQSETTSSDSEPDSPSKKSDSDDDELVAAPLQVSAESGKGVAESEAAADSPVNAAGEEITPEAVLAAIVREVEEATDDASDAATNETRSSTSTRTTVDYQSIVGSEPGQRALSNVTIQVDFTQQAESATRQQQEQEHAVKMETMAVGTTAVVSTGVSVGYVIWLLRGGTLLASMVSALPAWVSFDPLPILESHDNEKIDDEGIGDLL